MIDSLGDSVNMSRTWRCCPKPRRSCPKHPHHTCAFMAKLAPLTCCWLVASFKTHARSTKDTLRLAHGRHASLSQLPILSSTCMTQAHLYTAAFHWHGKHRITATCVWAKTVAAEQSEVAKGSTTALEPKAAAWTLRSRVYGSGFSTKKPCKTIEQ